MKINAAYVLRNLNGRPILEGKEPVTLKTVVVTGLVDPSQESVEIKQKKFKLAQRIFQAESVFEASLDEAKMLVESLPKYLSPIVVGQVAEVLEGNEPVFPSDFQEIPLSQE